MKLIKSVAIAALLCTFLSSAVANEETMIDISAFQKTDRPVVMFSHDNHNEKAELEECNICHHVYENNQLVADESSEDQTCSDCHNAGIKAAPLSLITAFHNRCKGCHLQLKKGPFLCSECHKKPGI